MISTTHSRHCRRRHHRHRRQRRTHKKWNCTFQTNYLFKWFGRSHTTQKQHKKWEFEIFFLHSFLVHGHPPFDHPPFRVVRLLTWIPEEVKRADKINKERNESTLSTHHGRVTAIGGHQPAKPNQTNRRVVAQSSLSISVSVSVSVVRACVISHNYTLRGHTIIIIIIYIYTHGTCICLHIVVEWRAFSSASTDCIETTAVPVCTTANASTKSADNDDDGNRSNDQLNFDRIEVLNYTKTD